MNRMRFVCISLFLVAALAATAAACPNCRDAIKQQGVTKDGGDLSLALNTSILAMLGILGTVTFGVVRMIVAIDRQTPMPPEPPAPAAGA